MPVPQYSDVGITSNPDPRPAYPTYADLNRNDVTVNGTGRFPKVSKRPLLYPYQGRPDLNEPSNP